MAEDWRRTIAAERMAVDDEFVDRIEAASLDRQQWNLVMTALEFEIHNPDDPAGATLVADTSKVDAVLDELDGASAHAQLGPGGPAAPSGSAGIGGSGGGILARVKDRLGLGGDGGDDRREEIEELAAEYADMLEERLRADGRWEEVRERATA